MPNSLDYRFVPSDPARDRAECSSASQPRSRVREQVAGSLPSGAARLAGAARAFAAALLVLVLGACSGSGGGGGAGGGTGSGGAQIRGVFHGRLVDVYGLRDTASGRVVELFAEDVLIGPDIQDERPPTSTKTDEEVLYDFIGTNPDNLQPRLLITRLVGSDEFEQAYGDLDNRVKNVTPALFGQDTALTPFSVVPRNAAIVVEFTSSLGVDQDFFVERDDEGRITGIKNTEAVQLLQIVGDPNDGDPQGDYRVVPCRVVPRGNLLIIDPVLLGSEGAQYQVRNNASGMPASADQVGANMRVAIAITGPLRIPAVNEAQTSPYVGFNNQGDRAVVRDFRSGNVDDNSADISRGFVRDAEPPRLIGEMLMYLERVEQGPDDTQVVTIFKNDFDHKLDRGDVLRIIDPATELVFETAEIIVEPTDDQGDQTVQHVRCIIRTVEGLEQIDPSNLPGYPSDLNEREAWLKSNAPKSVLVAEFSASRVDPDLPNVTYRDKPLNFLTFSPEPQPLSDGTPSPQGTNVSPFAEAILRFTKPVDLETVGAFDTFFFATRNVLDENAIRSEFAEPRNIDLARLNLAKFVTPHLVASRVIDEDGSQTAVRLQPTKGFYLDEQMRLEASQTPPVERPYFLHLLGGQDGVRDLAGNPIDFQSAFGAVDFIAIPFTLDTRKDNQNIPLYRDNIVVSVVRRFADIDEDEQPSVYIDDEVAKVDGATGAPLPAPAEAYPLEDVFGAVVYLADGTFQSRPTTRVTQVVDDLNQQPPPPQTSDLRFCPEAIAGEAMVASATAGVRFGQGIQNPLNPFGSRLQTLWREIDMSLSRVDPFDFNLDVEQMYWAPFTGGAITYDVFDRVSLFLGHSEYRPEPCVGSFSSLPELPNSGLRPVFADNYAHNLAPLTGGKTEDPAPHPAYIDQQLVIEAALAFTEPNGINRYLPLPEFQEPYFVWRDETISLQGGISGKGSDVRNANQNMRPYIISPWLGGIGRLVTGPPNALQFNRNFWLNSDEFTIAQTSQRDNYTGGGVHNIALPLLADFWTYCDDPDLPQDAGFVATGFNGWQIALTVQSGPTPNFRSYSGGFAGTSTRPSICVDTSSQAWIRAAGGYTPAGARTTTSADNSLYWVMADFLKRQSVATFGFVDVFNPHRMPAPNSGFFDPRLGPFLTDATGNPALPSNTLPQYSYFFEPPLESLPGGTSLVPEFRAASKIDPEPWRYTALQTFMGWGPELRPNEVNFPLDPLKAGDAGMRKFDNRSIDRDGNAASPRNHWTYYYNHEVTGYTGEITNLSRDTFTNQFAGPTEPFDASDVRYFNWRFVMVNNVNSSPPVSPRIDSFAITYRFERQ